MAMAPSAFGTTITIYNTGESSTGTALAAGTVDSHYTLVSAPSGATLSATATVANPLWTANTSTADWISPGNSGTANWPAGNYDYETTFSLAGLNAATAQLTGLWSSDNGGCIYLNGQSTGYCTADAGYGSLQSFSLASGFVAGTNTLDFIVNNSVPSPTGVFVEVSGTAGTAVTPEPSSLLLAASGMLTVGGMVRRRIAAARQDR